MTSMAAAPTALFERRSDDRYHPTTASIGPWDPGALHGGPPSALLAGALEVAAAEIGTFVPARITVELLRPVPMAELTVTTTVRRPGRKVCVVDATLSAGDKVVMSATLQGIRSEPVAHDWVTDLTTPDGPQTGIRHIVQGPAAFHNSGVEHRYLHGTSFDKPGPAVDWIRLLFPVVAGEETTPLQRVMAAADFGNGISGLWPMDEMTFINPDLSVFLYRPPVGEWVCLDAVTRVGAVGVAVAESLLFDELGPIGRSVQTLLVEPQ